MTAQVESILDELRLALRRGHAILRAPTGSGKSTRVPLALLDADWLAGAGILMLQPRRPAARLTAARMAALLGEPLGERVGYQIRFERRAGPRTRIEVVTEGILTRRLQSDPALTGSGLLIFDEFHERSLHADLGLALALDLAASLRPDLRLLVMSATLDTDRLAACLGGATVVYATGRSFPVTIRQADRAPPADPVAATTAAVRAALADDPGDLLVFLPGAREIAACQARLAPLAGADLTILPLHGSLSSAAQDAALRPPEPDGGPRPRRVVLATDIAETSLTIEGIGVVIDSGLTRKPRFDPASGLTRLVTAPIPRASAEQRAGRAGRLGPGICYRLWTQAQEPGRPEFRTPELLTADLAPLALELALWGVTDPSDLTWVDPPPAPAWRQAIDVLRALGALDPQGRIARHGRALATLPVHPRLAAMLLGAAPAARALAADLCALLTEPDPWIPQPGAARPAALDWRLRGLADWRVRPAASDRGTLDPRRLAAIDRVAHQLRELAERHAGDRAGAATPGALLALAYPERLARRRSGSDGRYQLVSGSGAALPRDDALAVHPWLAIARLEPGTPEGRIQLALPLDETELAQVAAARLLTEDELVWDAEREAVAARTVTRLGALRLTERPRSPADPAAAARLLLDQVARQFERALHWDTAARQLQARVRLLRALDPAAGWPDLDDPALRATLDDWLAPWLTGRARLDEVRRLDLTAILTARLDRDRQRRLDRMAPRTFRTPADTARPLDYLQTDRPVLAVPLQELFGLRETPRIADGRVPLLLHLLSPARRPLQVTQDLASFWSGVYPQLRGTLRARYPKHRWPEDPIQAPAVAGGLRRRLAGS